jgi:uncharacterized membrane protein YgaE (UPF0421/DUF939 family)
MTLDFFKQVAERSIMTFIQAFAAVFIVTDLNSTDQAVAAGLAAVLSVIKSMVATRFGDPHSASVI